MSAPGRRPGAGPIHYLVSSFRIAGALALRDRRTLGFGLLALVPALLPILVALLRPEHPAMLAGIALFMKIAEYGYLEALVPLAAVLLATALMGDEVEGGTLTYALSRPVPRSALVLGRFAAYVALTSAIFLPALLLTLLSAMLTATGPVDPGEAVRFLALTAAVILLADIAYGALGLALGALTCRPVVYSVVFIFGWEPLASTIPGTADLLTIEKHLLALWPAIASAGDAGFLVARKATDVSAGGALAALGCMVAALLAATTLTLRWKDFVRSRELV